MVQIFTDDCFAAGHSAQTDMQNIENNFAALKSAFSGSSAPANLVTGQWWFDTTANILKIRDEANTGWLSVWDTANNKPLLLNILVGDIPAAMKDAVAATASLRTLGTGVTQACAGNDARLSDARPASAGSVTQSKLSTTTGSVSVLVDNTGYFYTGYLPGGEYAFRELIKNSYADAHLYLGHRSNFATGNFVGTYHAPSGCFYGDPAGSTSDTCYIQERYVQACGEVHWIFSLKNRETGLIEKSWQAPDHPCFGNCGDPKMVPHPYGNYDEDKYELIAIHPPLDFVNKLKKRAGRGNCILSVIEKEYAIDEQSSPAWPTKKVAVALNDDELWDVGDDGKPILNPKCEDIKSRIPRPKNVITRVLKKKNKEQNANLQHMRIKAD